MATEKKFSIQPLGDRVLVKPDEKAGEKRLASGIIIPEAADKERPMTGVVIAVGPGKYEEGKLVPVGVKAGARVLFGKYGGHEEVKTGGEEYYLIAESNILAIVK